MIKQLQVQKQQIQELTIELQDSWEFSIAEKQEQWVNLLTEVESQLSNSLSKKIVQQLQTNYQLEDTLQLLTEEISSELITRLSILQQELKELANKQSLALKVQILSNPFK